MVTVSLYDEPTVTKDGGKLQSKIAIREEDNAQAARSYSTASSMSSVVRS